MLVDFTYEGEARSVRLRGSLEALGGSELHRAGRGRWTTSLDVPDDVRATYWFALDGEEDWTRWLPDPSNPKRYVYPAGLSFTGEREVVASLLEGPLAPSFRWSTERDVPHGVVEERELDGRPVWVYQPAGAPPEALLLLFDGREYTTIAPAPTVLDNLIAAGEIPPTGAVLPDSLDPKTRFRELGQDAAFLEWVVDRLLPWTGLTAPRARTVVAGSSMGGVASLFFARERPHVFGNALVQSGGFPGMPVVVPAGLPVRWYLDVGVLELRLLESTRELRDDLRAKGYEVAYSEFPGGHDFFWWRETLADGLIALLRPGAR